MLLPTVQSYCYLMLFCCKHLFAPGSEPTLLLNPSDLMLPSSTVPHSWTKTWTKSLLYAFICFLFTCMVLPKVTVKEQKKYKQRTLSTELDQVLVHESSAGQEGSVGCGQGGIWDANQWGGGYQVRRSRGEAPIRSLVDWQYLGWYMTCYRGTVLCKIILLLY